MNDFQKMKLIQEEHDAMRKSEGFKGNQYVKSGGDEFHHHQKNKTRSAVAQEHKITEHQVQKAVEFGRGLDKEDDGDA